MWQFANEHPFYFTFCVACVCSAFVAATVGVAEILTRLPKKKDSDYA